MTVPRWIVGVLLVGLMLTACAEALTERGPVVVPASTTSSTVPESATDPPGLTVDRVLFTPPVFASAPPPAEPRPDSHGSILPRDVSRPAGTPFARAGPVTLYHPSDSVELIGYHESNHDGAQDMVAVDGSAPSFTMASRDRGTGPQTAADVVVEPGVPILAPVSGVVRRAGSYTLYCDYRDHFVVIEPDDRPGWEVKVLHFLDLQVTNGDRVEGGSTIIGSGPRPLAFRSQVDDATSAPSWPHVHIEVVDPAIPDRPSGTSC